ncbi:hypothetical protein KGM_200451B, partial [Danaus plexippus plexippus]
THDANTLLGTLDSAFLFCYAGAMFISGMIAERVDLRYFLSLGMLVSAVFCYLFGLGRTLDIHDISFYLIVQAGAGIAQTTGWPGTVAIVGKWFGNAKKGLIFGLWNSHTSLGNILGTITAAKYVEYDWSLSFIYPALIMGVVAFIVFLFLAPEPKYVGITTERISPSRVSHSSDEDVSEVIVGDQYILLQSASLFEHCFVYAPLINSMLQAASLRHSRYSANTHHSDEVTEETGLLSNRPRAGAVSLTRALAIPGVIEFSLSLFFAKLVSYTFLYWLPMYIKSSTNLTPKQSSELSTAFDVGGVVGAALAGLLADWAGCPGVVCVGFYALCVPTLLAYLQWGATTYILNVCLLVVAGVLVNGPYALITTAVSAELGTHSSLAGDAQALATVTAIIDGTGSIGAAVGPQMAGLVSGVSWSYVFYMLVICDFLALVLLLRISMSEIARIRQERRLASPRLVRIE